MRNFLLRFAATGACVVAMTAMSGAQDKFGSFERDKLHEQLHQAYQDVSKNYYDPTFHGIDLAARYQNFDAQLNNETSNGQGFGVIAEFLRGLDDSHTYFVPPSRATTVTREFAMQMVGETCYVTHVRPGTDAAAKLHPGDAVLTYNGYPVNRHTLWLLEYMFGLLRVATSEEMKLRSPDGQERVVVVQNKATAGQKTYDLSGGNYNKNVWELIRKQENRDAATQSRVVTHEGVAIWKLPDFFGSPRELDDVYGKIRGHATLILDLRGNGGGSEDTLRDILGFLFEQDVAIAQPKGRNESKPVVAKGRGKGAYPGKLFVLVDSKSASGSELLARVVQLQNRGPVLGDRTAGAVMEGRYFREAEGAETKIFYGFEITDADMIMSDGKSLEKVGVTPEQILLPTASALAGGNDPVLAQAAALAGWDISPQQAGQLFPWEWAPE